MEEKTVLVVEDDEDTRILYATVLRHCGYRVIEAENGLEGLRLARQLHPAAIVMDMAMPVCDGWTATELLKQDERTRDIPILAVTVHDIGRGEAQRYWDGYLSKPCEPRRVAVEVAMLVGPPTRPGWTPSA